MKASFLTSTMLVCAAAISVSCHSLFPTPTGRLTLSFERPNSSLISTGSTVYSELQSFPQSSGALPKVNGDAAQSAGSYSSGIPSTDDFLLSITDSKGRIIYKGRFGDSPEEYQLSAGSYSVSAVSREFSSPAYGQPQFGDSKVIVVKAGETVNALLSCSQLNCGLRLVVEQSFRDTFPDGELCLSGSEGELIWSYDESRTAYFNPGSIRVSLNELGMQQLLFARSLNARQMLSVSLSCNSNTHSKGISIQIDSCRNYLEESYVYGDNSGSSPDKPLDINQARMCIGSEDQWVSGYVVGCAGGSGNFAFDPPFAKATNLLIGLRSSTTDPDYCLSVELKSGAIRDALNLVDNPGLKGKKVTLKGDIISSYFGIPGLKSVSEYCF